eukprot:CAMPEP_0178986586 /NCGR_PEP_ID=MMETSP0795-20121207/2783_1 /TAXON_ID=88552 /ORGANISM="Amoebophrya sp., Strain Ameob2" /LENGTH=266 /DNA_ID=CAMNT_0020677657 /DNA_START=1082 /DNA_END=1883 /DNA_ORIENTATION=-
MAKRFSGSELSFWGAGGGEFSSESFTDAELSSLVEEVVVFSESGDEASVEGGGEPSAVGSLFEAPKTPRGSLGGLQPKSPIVSTKVLGGIKIIQKLSPELHSRKYMGTRTKPDLETRAKKLGVTGQDMAVLDKITDKRPLAAERASRDGKLNYTPTSGNKSPVFLSDYFREFARIKGPEWVAKITQNEKKRQRDLYHNRGDKEKKLDFYHNGGGKEKQKERHQMNREEIKRKQKERHHTGGGKEIYAKKWLAKKEKKAAEAKTVKK